MRGLGFVISGYNKSDNKVEDNLSTGMIRIATCCIESKDVFTNKNRQHLFSLQNVGYFVIMFQKRYEEETLLATEFSRI